MTLERFAQLARMAAGFRGFAGRPLTRDQAVALIRRQMDERHARFLQLARTAIYDHAASPYRQLLLWAGCEPGDLEAAVRQGGIEPTLERLHACGVFLSLEEFKSLTPICRRGLTIDTRETDFDNPRVGRASVEGRTSGSRGRSTRVAYDWEFIAEESAHERLLYEIHGVMDAPLALWYPAPPGIAGLHNLLMSLKLGRAPEVWFSHTPTGAMPLEGRLAVGCLRWQCGAPRPEFADLSCAERVVSWLARVKARGTPGVVRTYGSSAVRIAQAALESGADVRGSVVFSGGEPLTEERRRFIESAGMQVFPRYVATESGLVAAACPHRESADDMHVYKDRLAVIESEGALYSTSLTMHAGKVLFNTGLGDRATLAVKPCRCLFGDLGFDLHLANVRSNEKLTVEGVTLLAADLHDAIGAAIEAIGGRPDAFQLRRSRSDAGLDQFLIVIGPDVPALDEAGFIEAVLDRVTRGRPGSVLAAEMWRQASTFRVVREHPRLSEGHKMLAVGPSRSHDDH